MNNFKFKIPKKDIYTGELVKIEYLLGKEAYCQRIIAGELLEIARLRTSRK